MLEWIIELLNKFAATVVKVLPTSPFRPYIVAFSDLPYLGYLNWFLPINACIKIGSAWLIAIAVFYLYSIILRWIKAIGG